MQNRRFCKRSLTKSNILYAYKTVGFVRGFVRTVTLTKPTVLLQIFDLQAELRSVSNVKIGG